MPNNGKINKIFLKIVKKYGAFYVSKNADEFFENFQKHPLFHFPRHCLTGILYDKI